MLLKPGWERHIIGVLKPANAKINNFREERGRKGASDVTAGKVSSLSHAHLQSSQICSSTEEEGARMHRAFPQAGSCSEICREHKLPCYGREQC